NDNRGMADITAGAAVFLRHRRTQHAFGTRLEPHFFRHDAVVLPLRVKRHDLAIDKTADLMAKQFVVFAINGAHEKTPERMANKAISDDRRPPVWPRSVAHFSYFCIYSAPAPYKP